MAGIYFHIPFCKQACYYCDFHFSTSLRYKEDMVKALQKELILQKPYLANQKIETVYFGGGTPSLLTSEEIKRMLATIEDHFLLIQNPEITLEANPDDLKDSYIQSLKNSGINRFSIGIQSFFEEDLKWMNRAHTAQEADFAVKAVQDAGFENITLDLIYGFPLLTNHKWDQNIQKVVNLNIPHISAYSMTIEPRTALAGFIQQGKQKPMDEEQSSTQFQYLCQKLADNGFEQYEISNFSFPNHHSLHNSNYWKGIPYLGIGPSAHSFNGNSRRWNVRNNMLYLKSIAKNELNFEEEILSKQNQLNEYIMTSLRTKWGIDFNYLRSRFSADLLEEMEMAAASFIAEGLLQKEKDIITLTPKGKLFADKIASDLFVS